jgi:hypothetical protein
VKIEEESEKTPYILVIFMFYHNGATTTSIEFDSLEAAENAQDVLSKKIPESITFNSACVKKG